jgi:mRNA-degrading endonuclease RelE of RelBE toxin-antitoxin system
MEAKTLYEEEILKEIRNLSEPLQEKLFKIIHLLKQEIIKPEYDEKLATDEFLSICGIWEDDRTVEE